VQQLDGGLKEKGGKREQKSREKVGEEGGGGGEEGVDPLRFQLASRSESWSESKPEKEGVWRLESNREREEEREREREEKKYTRERLRHVDLHAQLNVKSPRMRVEIALLRAGVNAGGEEGREGYSVSNTLKGVQSEKFPYFEAVVMPK